MAVAHDRPVSLEEEDRACPVGKFPRLLDTVLRHRVTAQPEELTVMRRQDHGTGRSAQYIYIPLQRVYAVRIQHQRLVAKIEHPAHQRRHLL